MKFKIISIMIISIFILSSFSILMSNNNVSNIINPASTSNPPTVAYGGTQGMNLTYNNNIQYVNYTLPNFSEYELVDKNIIQGASLTVGSNSNNYYSAFIMSRYNTYHTLGFYYINESNDLVFTNYFTNKTIILEANIILPDIYKLSSAGYGYLNYYQNINGSIQYLYWYGYYHNYYYVNVYDTYSVQSYLVNTSIKNITASGFGYQIEIFNSQGYMLFSSNQNDTVYVISLSDNIYHSTVSNFDFPQGNSPEYFIGLNSFEESYTSSGVIYFVIIGFNITSHVFTNITLSGTTDSGATSDVNNNPIYEKLLSNGTLFAWGLSMNDGSSLSNYEVNGFDVFANVSKDVMVYNYGINSEWDSEVQSNNVIISNSMLIQQATNGYPFASGVNHLAPFRNLIINPTYSEVYYSENKYINNLFANETYSAGEISSSINDIASYNGYMNVINRNFAEPLTTTNWQIMIYWLSPDTTLTAIENTNTSSNLPPTQSQIYYKIDFKIFGLPTNTSWAVLVNNTEYISNSSFIIVYLEKGIYNPIIVIPDGYTLNDVGTLVVNGNNSYYIQVSESPFNFIVQNMGYLVVFIFIMMIFLIAIALRRRREE